MFPTVQHFHNRHTATQFPPDHHFSTFSVISESLNFQLNFPAGFYQEIQQQFLSDLQLIELSRAREGRRRRGKTDDSSVLDLHIFIWTGSYHEQIKYETISQRTSHLTSVKKLVYVYFDGEKAFSIMLAAFLCSYYSKSD